MAINYKTEWNNERQSRTTRTMKEKERRITIVLYADVGHFLPGPVASVPEGKKL